MLYVSNSSRQTQTVIVLRPPSRIERTCPYSEILKSHGIDLIERPTLDGTYHAICAGCRVGLLIIAREEDLHYLDTCEPFLNINKISWIGLIAQELVSLPRVRQLIGKHLFNFITTPANLDHIVL